MDLVKKDNMECHYDRYCNKCSGKVVMHAFSDGECTICKGLVQTSHTPCDEVCNKCSVEKNLCMSCGTELHWVPKVWSFEKQGEGNYLDIKPLPIDADESELTSDCVIMTDDIIAHLGIKAENDVSTVIDYANHLTDENQRLEGLILSWRSKLKNELIWEASRLTTEEISVKEINELIDSHLKEFDEHFNITVQREGQV